MRTSMLNFDGLSLEKLGEIKYLCVQLSNVEYTVLYSVPLVELDIIFIVEPLGFGVSVNPQLFCFLSQGVAVLPGVLRYLQNITVKIITLLCTVH